MCWKFFTAIANRVLEAEFLARVDAARGFRKPLSSHEHAQLREAMSADELNTLTEWLFCENVGAMDGAVRELGRRLVDQSGVTSSMFHDRCNGLLEWLASELGEKARRDIQVETPRL